VIAMADSIDQTYHVIYDDTAALGQTIRQLDNPFGRLFMRNTLGKAYYYMGRNLEDSYQQIAEAAECYIEADRLQIDDPIYRGRVNSCMGYLCARNNSDSLALVFYERASEHFQKSGNEWRYAQSLLDVSYHLTSLHRFILADSILQMAYSYQLDSAYMARLYETKGLYFYEQQQYDSALVYFYKGLDYWQGEIDKCFTYMKIMQIYDNTDNLPLATSFAQLIIERSTKPNHIVNAYYCLIQDAKLQNDITKLSQYSRFRADANRLLLDNVKKCSESIRPLERYLSNPHPWRWVWIIISIFAFICIVLSISIILYRKYATIRLQDVTASLQEKIDDLSVCVHEQKLVQTDQQRQYDVDMCLSNIRARYSKPCKQWSDYNLLKKDLCKELDILFSALDNSELRNREKVFCIFMIVYSHCSLIELANYINYSEKGIRNYKQRIAHKLKIPSAELYDYLLRLLKS